MILTGWSPPGDGPTHPGASDGDPVDLAPGLFVYSKTDLYLPDVLPIRSREPTALGTTTADHSALARRIHTHCSSGLRSNINKRILCCLMAHAFTTSAHLPAWGISMRFRACRDRRIRDAYGFLPVADCLERRWVELASPEWADLHIWRKCATASHSRSLRQHHQARSRHPRVADRSHRVTQRQMDRVHLRDWRPDQPGEGQHRADRHLYVRRVREVVEGNGRRRWRDGVPLRLVEPDDDNQGPAQYYLSHEYVRHEWPGHRPNAS